MSRDTQPRPAHRADSATVFSPWLRVLRGAGGRSGFGQKSALMPLTTFPRFDLDSAVDGLVVHR
jgi:hypothetical protein